MIGVLATICAGRITRIITLNWYSYIYLMAMYTSMYTSRPMVARVLVTNHGSNR